MLELKITTLIIEKDQQSLNETVAVLKGFNELSIVGKAITGKNGFRIGNNLAPYLVFINTDLPDISGLDFIRSLRKRDINPEVVFISNDARHAFEALPLKPFDYFVRPLDPALISRMITRLKFKYKKAELMRKMDEYTKMQTVNTKRVFHQKKGIIVLRLEEIVFCKAELSSTVLKLRTGESVIVKTKIGETIEIINHKEFIRTGRSYYINREYLRKIDKKNLKCMLYYEGQTWDIPVSKNTVGLLEKLNVYPIY